MEDRMYGASGRAEVDPAEERADFTDDGFDPRCPFCSRRASRACTHLIGKGNTGSADWDIDPFGDRQIPTFGDVPSEADDGAEWSDEQVRDAFGDLAPALEGYARFGLSYRPGPPHLLDALRPFLATPVVERSSLESVMGELNAKVNFFAADPDAARTELAGLLVRLGDGFRRLAAMPPCDIGE